MAYIPHVEKAEELSATHVRSYTITDGFFKSTGKYPFFADKVEGNRISNSGDALLWLYSHLGEFRVVFPDFKLQSKNKRLYLFEGGLPLMGQCGPPRIERDNPDSEIYAVYEIYGNKERRQLADVGGNNDAGYGCKVRDPETNNVYIVTGRYDPGHSHNTLVPYKD